MQNFTVFHVVELGMLFTCYRQDALPGLTLVILSLHGLEKGGGHLGEWERAREQSSRREPGGLPAPRSEAFQHLSH